MTPETFNAQLAQRKLEAADILLVQAKRGSDADRIRAASAILRIAFMAEPKEQKAAAQPPVTKGAPACPQRSEDMPGEPPSAHTPSLREGAGGRVLCTPNASVPINNSAATRNLLVNSS